MLWTGHDCPRMSDMILPDLDVSELALTLAGICLPVSFVDIFLSSRSIVLDRSGATIVVYVYEQG